MEPKDQEVWNHYLHSVKRSFLLFSAGYLTLDFGGFEFLFNRYFKSPVSRQTKVEWISRVMSSVNCLWMLQGVGSEFYRNQKLLDDFLNGFSPKLITYSASFAGYAIYDTLLILANSHLRDPSILAHHIGLISVITFCNLKKIFYPLGAAWTLNETSTIFLNQRWFFSVMAEHGNPVSSTLVNVNLGLTYLSFFFFRVLIHIFADTRAIVQVINSKQRQFSHLVVASGIPFLATLNFYWFYRMTLLLLKVLKKK